MKLAHRYLAVLSLLFLLASCGGGGGSLDHNAQSGSSKVVVNIGSGVNRAAAADAQYGKVPTVTTLLFTISAPDMDTIIRIVPITPPVTVTEQFDVPNGDQRVFVVEARDAGGFTAYSGSATADLSGTAVTLTIPMVPLFFAGTTLTGTADDDEGTAIARDSSGSIVIVGNTYGDLDGNLNSDATHATPDIFVKKFDVTGAPLWTRMTGSAGFDLVYGVAVDASGNIFVVGNTVNSLDGQANAGGIDCFVTRYDTDGNKIWTRLLGSADDDFCEAVAVDAGGTVHVAGYTYGGLGTFTNADANGAGFSADLFAASFDTNGNQLWLDQRGTPFDDHAEGIAVDAAGNVYLTGSTLGGLDGNTNAFGPAGSTYDLFLVKYDAAHVWQWTRQLGTGEDELAWAVAVDAAGNAYVAGESWGDLDGQPNANPGLAADAFVVMYDAAGSRQWVTLFGTAGDDVAQGIALDNSGNVLVSGSTSGAFPGATNAGGYDIFIGKGDPVSQTWSWASETGSAGDDYAHGIAVDGRGHAYVTGSTSGIFDGITNNGLTDAFLMSVDDAGVKQ